MLFCHNRASAWPTPPNPWWICWRVQIEVFPDGGHAGAAPENIPAPSLAGFGLPSPDHLTSLSMAYQIAQKVHACTDPHDPPASVNDRARDVVDLLLLRDLIDATQHPTLSEVRAAIEDIFTTAPRKPERSARRPAPGRREALRIRTGGRASPEPPTPQASPSPSPMPSTGSTPGSNSSNTLEPTLSGATAASRTARTSTMTHQDDRRIW
jgi:hypothetical protein